MKTIALICGGRDYNDSDWIYHILDQALDFYRDLFVIQGGASGADRWAKAWANDRGIHSAEVSALWYKFGRKAGTKRNTEMLILKPDIGIAFPGGYGTQNMILQMRQVKIPVFEIAPRSDYA